MDKPNVPIPPRDTLNARKESPLAQFSDKIGKVEIIEKDIKTSGFKSSIASHGFHCSTCNASFTSSDAFLDHCNGKVHQKNLGISFKVERVDEVDRVKARLEQLTRKRLATEMVIESKTTSHFEKKLDEALAETENLKEERKSRKKQKKKQINEPEPEDESKDSENSDELMALMGFSAFS